MNALLRSGLARAQKVYRRLKEKTGLASGFSDMEMHLWMLADGVRAEAFERAISRTVRPGDVVVDLGAGTGLLSLMACRAGASKVYAIEESPIPGLVESIAGANACSDRIVLVRGNSRKIALPERADVVVSETIGAFAFSEDILPSLVDARERLLKPSGSIIPERLEVYLAPVESFEEGIGLLERPMRGFDFTPARRHVPVGTMAAARRVRRSHFLADAATAYDIDFRTADAAISFDRTLSFTAARDGTLHGFVGFWEAQLHGDVRLRCDPDGPPLHWPPVLFRLPAGIPVAGGARITLAFGRRDRPGWSWKWEARVEDGGARS